MNRRHTLKCWPSSFQSIWDGVKTFEIRKNDRGYQEGDSLQLMEFFPETNTYSGRVIGATVKYIVYGGSWGLPEDICVMAIYVWGRTTLDI